MKNLMYLFIAISIVLTACKKEKVTNREEQVHQNLLIKRTDNDGLVFNYTYDGNNRLTNYTRNSNQDNPKQNVSFLYNSSGSLAEYTESERNYRTKFSYNSDGSINKKQEYKINGTVETLTSVFSYTYTLGAISENYVDPLSGNGWRQVYTFDANNNVTEVKAFKNVTPANPNGTFDASIFYGGYDTKISASLPFPKELLFPQNANNNATKVTYPWGVTAYVYEYNADGYVIKKSDGTNISTYEYRRL